MTKNKQTASSPIQVFHNKVTKELQNHLKRYQHLHPLPILSKQFQSKKNFMLSSQAISQFLYQVLQLELASVNFIIKQALEQAKRSSWHADQVLKIVLDIQFVIPVGNYVTSKQQFDGDLDIKNKQISFKKIQLKDLVSIIQQNCFFIQNSQNSISKTLISEIVNQINVENGNKGHILLVEYKNFMLKHMIEKHSLNKLHTPKKQKSWTPTPDHQKHQLNSPPLILNIKEVEEDSSSATQKSNLNSQDSELKFGKHRIINIQDKNTHIFPLSSIEKTKQKLISITDFQRMIWTFLKNQISHDSAKSINQLNQQSKPILTLKKLIKKKFIKWNQTSIERIFSKLEKIQRTNLQKSVASITSTFIKIIGEEGFKIFHDKMMKKSENKGKYILYENEIREIISNSYLLIIEEGCAENVLKQVVRKILQSAQSTQKSFPSVKYINFKDYLMFVQTLCCFPQY